MRIYLLAAALLALMGTAAQAQEYKVRVTMTYTKGSRTVEQAVETLVATASVGEGANVLFKAGKAVILEPGFQVSAGGRFEARIESVRDVPVLAVRVHPNPVQRRATIEYDLPEDSRVIVQVFETNGRLVETLFEGTRKAGSHSTEWNATDASAGVYLYSLKTDKEIRSGRMVKQ